jgi:hypothetical protein
LKLTGVHDVKVSHVISPHVALFTIIYILTFLT